MAGSPSAELTSGAMRSLKMKYAVTGAALGVLLVIACVSLALLLRRPGNSPLSAVIIGVGVAAVALTALGAFLMGRRITRELEQLNDSTSRISQGDYTQPVRTLRDDELGDLQRTCLLYHI